MTKSDRVLSNFACIMQIDEKGIGVSTSVMTKWETFREGHQNLQIDLWQRGRITHVFQIHLISACSSQCAK